ncbi:hypothetical protein LV164_000783 [Aspergillus fumigatus]|nr:hypothetical protein KXX42_008315 [Aspergillus fumigatus]KAH1555580.1 hypothetical protein KXX57_003259 [Aspergillus fumigatus]KAH1983446.1 hypothetical protein KXW88_003380 [Aspergillus fumigatus]KAH2314770.1 hypothetical protein KXV47_002285 [Aspergillus fumigatus]KAH2667792.1 hypothetical protein KXV32_005759 [Aspergillus fumigatus]
MEITDFVFKEREDVLLAGDYNAYRAHTTRRLHKLRKKLGQTTPKGRKYTAKPPVSAEDISNNVAYVHVLLLSSERAWAQAMHMKSTHSADPSAKGIAGSARRHIMSRLNKASGYSQQLVLLLEDQATSGASDTDILEAHAYLASLLGAIYLEKRKWEQCIQSYAVSRIIYTTLGREDRKDAFRDLLTGTIDPSIRYAAYQMKLPRSRPLSSLAIQYFPSDANIRSKVERVDPDCLKENIAGTRKTADGEIQQLPESITWRSRTVALEDATISQALASAAAAESRLKSWLADVEGKSASSKDKAAAYDSVIIASQDAVDATKTAIDDLANEGVEPSDKRMQSLQITRTAVNYALVGWRIGRNRVLCGTNDGMIFETDKAECLKRGKGASREESTGKKLTRLREKVVLYDSILQSIEFILELPGVAADTTFVQELEAKRCYFRALRCLSIARSHCYLGNSKNALALYSQAMQLTAQSTVSDQSSQLSNEPLRLDVSRSQVQTLGSILQGLVAQYRGLVTLEKMAAEGPQTGNQRPVIERLHEYSGDKVDLSNLVPYPPQMQPIPVKPLFLDVAWNYIDYPREGAHTQEETQPPKGTGTDEKKGGRRGWFGFGR